MYAVTSTALVSLTRATCEAPSSASGVVVYAGARHGAAGFLECRGLDLGDLVAATLADQLLNGWHYRLFLISSSSAFIRSVVLLFRPCCLPAAGRVARGRTAEIHCISRCSRHAKWPDGHGGAHLSARHGLSRYQAATPLQNRAPGAWCRSGATGLAVAVSHAGRQSQHHVGEHRVGVDHGRPITPEAITPVISSRTNPCNAAQNSSAA